MSIQRQTIRDIEDKTSLREIEDAKKRQTKERQKIDRDREEGVSRFNDLNRTASTKTYSWFAQITFTWEVVFALLQVVSGCTLRQWRHQLINPLIRSSCRGCRSFTSQIFIESRHWSLSFPSASFPSVKFLMANFPSVKFPLASFCRSDFQ